MGDPNGTLQVLASLVFAGVVSMAWGLAAVSSAVVSGSHDLLATGHGSFVLGLWVTVVALMVEKFLFPWV